MGSLLDRWTRWLEKLEEQTNQSVASVEQDTTQAWLNWASDLIVPQLLAHESKREGYPYDYLHYVANYRRKKGNYAVYVILLDSAAREKRARTNTGEDGMPCVYVGQTGKTVRERYHDHLVGYKSRIYIRENAIGLLPKIYTRYNPLPGRDSALDAEAALAAALRHIGCTVFGGH